MRRILALLLAVPFTTACHTYVPVGVESVRPEMAVRVRLADRPTSGALEGQIVDAASPQRGFTLLPEVGQGLSSEPFFVESPNIEALERRELDRGRTALLVGGTALLGLGTILLIDGDPAAEGTPPGGGIVFLRLPFGP